MRPAPGKEDEIRSWLAVNRVPELASRLLRQVEGGGEGGGGEEGGERLVSRLSGASSGAVPAPDWEGAERDLRWLEPPTHHLVRIVDPGYPPRLRTISQPPLLLFVRGGVELLGEPQLAIVGSRNPTRGGEDTAFRFAGALAQAGLVITSGLAVGIDAAAHRGAVAAARADVGGGLGASVAVFGTGLDRVYPRRNLDLAVEVERIGAIVSEFPLGTPPRRDHFPRRNRIISGLSLGVLVVEAAVRSGSLTTARWAAEQGREVFAIPGSIHNPLARGCHRLIRDGAKLVESVGDVLEELRGQIGLRELALTGSPDADVTRHDTSCDPRLPTIIRRSRLRADTVRSSRRVHWIDARGGFLHALGA